MSEEEKLKKIRDEIDQLDLKIQSLINSRAKCAQQVAEIKIQSGEAEHFYRPEREAQVLRAIESRHQGPLGG